MKPRVTKIRGDGLTCHWQVTYLERPKGHEEQRFYTRVRLFHTLREAQDFAKRVASGYD